jgi:hypothetical protein
VQIPSFVRADGGVIYWVAEDPDYSTSWFEHVESLGFIGKVIRVDPDLWRGVFINSAIDKRPDGTTTDVVEASFVTVYTEHGRLTIDMRTDSNGYYRGAIAVTTDMDPKEAGPWVQIEA